MNRIDSLRLVGYAPKENDATISGKPVFQGQIEEVVDILCTQRPAKPNLVITPNVDHVNRLALDPKWRSTFEQGDLFVVDGKLVEVLFRGIGASGVCRITGADLLPAVCERASQTGHRVVIIGGKDEIRRQAVNNLREEYGEGLDVRGVSVPFSNDGLDQAAREVAELKPDVAFVCLSSPKQEHWVVDFADILPPAWYVGAGAAVDFAAGVVQRAPGFVQKYGLEWIYRLVQEPRRLAHRYLVVGPVFLGVIASALVDRWVLHR